MNKILPLYSQATRVDTGAVVIIAGYVRTHEALLYRTEDFKDGHTALLDETQLTAVAPLERLDPAKARRYQDYLASFPLHDPRD